MKCIAAGLPGESSVWFEPFTYCMALSIIASSNLNIWLPLEYKGNEEIFEQAASMLGNIYSSKFKPEHLAYGSIKRLMEKEENPFVFVKDQAYAITSDRLQFLPQGYKHVFLIRHPLRVFRSFRKIAFANTAKFKPAVKEEDFDLERDHIMFDSAGLYFRSIYELWNYVKENFENDPIVLDGDDLLAKPTEMIPKFCKAIGLPYNEAMLKWDPSADIVKGWVHPAEGMVEELMCIYAGALTSSEFAPANPMPCRDHVTPDVIRLTDQVMKYYEEMYETRMKV